MKESEKLQAFKEIVTKSINDSKLGYKLFLDLISKIENDGRKENK